MLFPAVPGKASSLLKPSCVPRGEMLLQQSQGQTRNNQPFPEYMSNLFRQNKSSSFPLLKIHCKKDSSFDTQNLQDSSPPTPDGQGLPTYFPGYRENLLSPHMETADSLSQCPPAPPGKNSVHTAAGILTLKYCLPLPHSQEREYSSKRHYVHRLAAFIIVVRSHTRGKILLFIYNSFLLFLCFKFPSFDKYTSNRSTS